MDKFTQKVIDKLKYNHILSRLLAPSPLNSPAPNIEVHTTIMIIAFTSGLPLEYIIELKWGEILSLNSKSQPKIHEKINISRYYDFPINHKLHKRLSNCYKNLKSPPIESKIIDGYTSYRDFKSILYGIRTLLIGIGENALRDMNSYKIDDKYLTQIIFGRRVFEVCGYTTKTSKRLKTLFKLKTNEELFNFLGYSSRSGIKYNLSNISLDENKKYRYENADSHSFMDDNKHFNIKIGNSKEHYPFQHFQVFHDFIYKSQLYKFPIITNGIAILLLLSLTNGIRLSLLLKLKWSDFFLINEKESTMTFKKKIKFGDSCLNISEEILNRVQSFFSTSMRFYGIDMEKKKVINLKGLTYETLPNLEYPLVISNKGNQLTQPSLHRELIKALHELGFIHADKFTTKSTLIMYGRRIIELKGDHKPTIKHLKEHFNFRSTQDLFNFLYIDEHKGDKGIRIKGFDTVWEHILYDV